MTEKLKGPATTLLSWKEIATYAWEVGEKIKASGYKPDAIVGITRGGWVHARIQCDLLLVKDLYAVKIEHWGLTAVPDGSARLTVPVPPEHVQDKKLLVIDDITDTGKSFILATKHLDNLGVTKDIKTATLLHIKGAEFTPDFYAREVDWAWFAFPWNYYEDMSNLTMALFDGEKTQTLNTSEIQQLFKEYNRIDRSIEQLEVIKKHITWLGRIKPTEDDNWERI